MSNHEKTYLEVYIAEAGKLNLQDHAFCTHMVTLQEHQRNPTNETLSKVSDLVLQRWPMKIFYKYFEVLVKKGNMCK